jgi:hypothetical protein
MLSEEATRYDELRRAAVKKVKEAQSISISIHDISAMFQAIEDKTARESRYIMVLIQMVVGQLGSVPISTPMIFVTHEIVLAFLEAQTLTDLIQRIEKNSHDWHADENSSEVLSRTLTLVQKALITLVLRQEEPPRFMT